MKRRRPVRPGKSRKITSLRTACSLGSVLALAGLASCHEIDTTRVAPFKATLGDDLYGTHEYVLTYQWIGLYEAVAFSGVGGGAVRSVQA